MRGVSGCRRSCRTVEWCEGFQPGVRRAGCLPVMRVSRARSMSEPRYQSPVWSME